MSITAESICNMTLGHLKIGKEITNLTTDKSAEAAACRLYYAICRDIVLGAHKWPFAKMQVALALVEEDPFEVTDSAGNTASEWALSYRYPSDAANLIRILSGIRNEARDQRIPYRIYRDDVGKLILTDVEDAWVEYTRLEQTEDRWDPQFAMALSLKLAVYTAPRLTGGDPFKLGARAKELYKEELSNALENALNEEQIEEDPEAESIRARY